jgi:hypothetical protein
MLTNRQLLERLQELTPEQLDMTATVMIDPTNCEFYAITDTTLFSEYQCNKSELEELIEDDIPLLLIN